MKSEVFLLILFAHNYSILTAGCDSTVTDLAKFLCLSTSVPSANAVGRLEAATTPLTVLVTTNHSASASGSLTDRPIGTFAGRYVETEIANVAIALVPDAGEVAPFSYPVIGSGPTGVLLIRPDLIE